MTDKTPQIQWATQLNEANRPVRRDIRLPDSYQTSVYVYYRAVDSPCRPPVLYVHGIQSHPGWFSGSTAHLAARGHTVYAVTRRGSGENRQDRGHAESARQLLEDIEAAGKFALADSGARKLALVGVSWGGKLLSCYAAWSRRQIDIASLTLVAPGIVPRVDLPLSTRAAIGLAMLCCPRRLFDVPLDEVELFTDNKAMQSFLRCDPCRLHKATSRFLYASRRLDMMLSGACNGAIAAPTTLILAGRDRIIDNAATRGVVARLTAGSAVVEELDGCHSLEFETNPLPFLQVLEQATNHATTQT